MKRALWIPRAAVGLALIGLLVPQRPVLAQAPQQTPTKTAPAPAATTPADEVTDVALASGGVFSGQVVDAQGRPQVAASVTLSQKGEVKAQATTDEQGQFSVAGLQGGIYQMASGQQTKIYRLWAPDTAPPAAKQAALFVAGGQVVRGQGGLRYWLTNPWVLAVGVAAAIAVPIALSNREKAPTS